MSLHPSSAARRAAQRVTIWPTAYGEDIELSAPWPGRFGPQQPDKRWTGAFDSEARANRMSYMVGNSLLPSAAPSGPPVWPGQARGNRTTWIDDRQQVWDGSFDVEKRESWIGRTSERWSDDFGIEKEKARWKEPLTKEQLAQAKGPLVSVDILNYDFPGYGTPDDPYLVRWIENDPANPMVFPTKRKWTNAMVLAFAVFMVSIASSGFSQGMYMQDRILPPCVTRASN
jgi:hypothetical protein